MTVQVMIGRADFISLCPEAIGWTGSWDTVDDDCHGIRLGLDGIYIVPLPPELCMLVGKEEVSYFSEHPEKDLKKPVLAFPCTVADFKNFFSWWGRGECYDPIALGAFAGTYPKELRIALEVWDKVFSQGLKPQSPPVSQHEMVRLKLKPYSLEEGSPERIRYIIVANKTPSPVTETTTSPHTWNEPGHPHHAPLLEIAVKLWEACESRDPYKKGAKKWLTLNHGSLGVRERRNILEMTNPNSGGGRPKKGV